MDVDRNVVLANFQACTTIEDIGVCMAILDQHDWDLQNAVHAALQSQENENTSNSASQPAAPQQRPRSPPRPSRQITFLVRAQGREKKVTLDESSHVGTLLEVAAAECNISNDDPRQFSGWPSGEQPDNDIPLSMLSLPSTVNLIHNSPAASTSTSRITVEQEQRKDRHFVLNIYDRGNNERHSLKYPGRKIIADIKRDVYSLTLIPNHRQAWNGWPSNYGEELQLWQLSMTGFELNLIVDDNLRNESAVSSSNRVTVPERIPSDSDDDADDVDDDDDDEPYDDAFQDVEMNLNNRRIKKSLISNTSGDYQQATMELVTEFQRRFGEQTPIWFIGSLDDAAKEAYGAKTKTNDRKMLAIYIHNEKSISANIFCSQILCSTEIVNFLSENCISWAFDVTEYENKHRVNNQIDKMFGSQMAANLRRMTDDEFPILILANGKGPTNEATEIVKGDNSIDDVMTKLLHSLDISNTRKQEDIQTEFEREQRENEISEQESAYEQSIRADRDRMLKQQEDEDRKRNEENKQRKEEAENLKKKEEMENRLPSEPPATAKNICQLRFRFPDGRTALRRFYEIEKLSVLFIYIGSEGFQETTYRLLRQFPRADLSSLKRSKTLKELGLKQDNLVVEAQANDESEDESDDESMDE